MPTIYLAGIYYIKTTAALTSGGGGYKNIMKIPLLSEGWV